MADINAALKRRLGKIEKWTPVTGVCKIIELQANPTPEAAKEKAIAEINLLNRDIESEAAKAADARRKAILAMVQNQEDLGNQAAEEAEGYYLSQEAIKYILERVSEETAVVIKKQLV